MDETTGNVTCPNCKHVFPIRDDVVVKLNHIGKTIDNAADILLKAMGEMSANPMLSAFIGKRG